MSFDGVKVNKAQGGLGRRNPSEDGVVALVYPVTEIAGKLEHFNAYELLQLSDAEAMDINESYDANNNTLLHYHISEFFRLAPDGKLFLIATDGTITGDDTRIKELIRANSTIKVVGMALPATDIDDLTGAKIAAVQGMVDDLRAQKIYIDNVILNGVGYAAETPIANYPDLRAENAPNVQVCIAKDPVTDVLSGTTTKEAALGSALGMIAVRGVNENMGSVDILVKPDLRKGEENYTLTTVRDQRWLSSLLTDGTDVSKLSVVDLNTLTQKGYIYVGSFPAYGGMFFSGDPTCVELASDYAYGHHNRIWNKAARGVYQAGVPKVRSVLKKNEDGTLRATTIASIQATLEKPLEYMMADGEISAFEIYIDPAQFPTDSTPLMIVARILKDGILHTMEIDLGLTNRI